MRACKANRTTYEVVVVGAGITGLSTAYHLHRAGISKIAVISHEEHPSATRQTPGLIMGGQADNFTRFAHAHGDASAAELWRFGDNAFKELVAFASNEGLRCATNQSLRLITSEPERREASKAVEALNAAHFHSRLITNLNAGEFSSLFSSRVDAVQVDGHLGGSIDVQALLARLYQLAAANHIAAKVEGVTNHGDHVELQLADNSEPIRSELVVLACHHHIAHLVPSLSEAIIPYVDEWLAYELPAKIARALHPLHHTAIMAHYSNEWGLITDRRIAWGGGRYLRPMAGIGAQVASLDVKVTGHLDELLAKTFVNWSPAMGGERPVIVQASIDVRPCDELPIVGPMFGEDRLLVATGYMGLGLAQGFYAGACLSDLIASGACPKLPRLLWPERLRSMAVSA